MSTCTLCHRTIPEGATSFAVTVSEEVFVHDAVEVRDSRLVWQFCESCGRTRDFDALAIPPPATTVAPRAAAVAPGDSLTVRAMFDATDLPTGMYYDVITLVSNDPAGPHHVHVTLAIGGATGVGDGPPATAIAGLAGWPNPFNPRTMVRFDLPRAGRVELAVFDLQGRRVRTLLAGNAAAGPHEVLWQGDDDAGRTLPSGVYLARLRGPGGTAAERKLTLVR